MTVLLWVVRQRPPTNPRWRTTAIVNFAKMLISLYWIQIYSHNFIKMQHRQTTDNICKMVSACFRESVATTTSSFFYATCYVSYITLYAVTACITSTKWAAHTTLTNYPGKWWLNFQLTHPKMSSLQIYSAYSEDGLNMYNFHTSGLLPDISKLPTTCTHTSHAGKHSWYVFFAYRL